MMHVYFYASLVLLATLPGCTQPSSTILPVVAPGSHHLPDEVRLAGSRPAAGLAFPAVFEAAFRPGTTVRQDSTLFYCHPLELGHLRSETGKLVAGDPITIADAQAFTQRFPLGDYPVQVALLRFRQDERIGFVRVVFDTARVARWQPARLPGQRPLTLRDSTVHCYGVDAGLGAVMDSAANQQFAHLGHATWSHVFIDAAGQPNYAGYVYRFEGHSLATFPTGLGDGCYATYLGFSAAGRVCCLLTDFDMINW